MTLSEAYMRVLLSVLDLRNSGVSVSVGLPIVHGSSKLTYAEGLRVPDVFWRRIEMSTDMSETIFFAIRQSLQRLRDRGIHFHFEESSVFEMRKATWFLDVSMSVKGATDLGDFSEARILLATLGPQFPHGRPEKPDDTARFVQEFTHGMGCSVAPTVPITMRCVPQSYDSNSSVRRVTPLRCFYGTLQWGYATPQWLLAVIDDETKSDRIIPLGNCDFTNAPV